MGVDFVGGLMIEEKFESPPPLDEVRQTIESLDVGEATLQQFGDPHTISIRLPAPETTDEGATNAIVNKVETALSAKFPGRSEEHTSELQSLMRISYAVFCLKKKKNKNK